MNNRYLAIVTDDYLAHHGIKGQKWGLRRFQNPDGSLTDAGRVRYGKNNGSRKFVKDLIRDTARSRGTNHSDYFDKVERWGKTAEELKIMNPKDPSSYSGLGGAKGYKNAILHDVYIRMPSVSKLTERRNRNTAKIMTKEADGFKQENIQHLDHVIDKFHPNLHKELGTKSGKDTRNYIMDAVKGYNETDPDAVIFQRMEEAWQLYDQGYISTKTFSKLYDGEVAENSVNFLGYGWGPSEIKGWHDRFQEVNRPGISQEARIEEFIPPHPR